MIFKGKRIIICDQFFIEPNGYGGFDLRELHRDDLSCLVASGEDLAELVDKAEKLLVEKIDEAKLLLSKQEWWLKSIGTANREHQDPPEEDEESKTEEIIVKSESKSPVTETKDVKEPKTLNQAVEWLLGDYSIQLIDKNQFEEKLKVHMKSFDIKTASKLDDKLNFKDVRRILEIIRPAISRRQNRLKLCIEIFKAIS